LDFSQHSTLNAQLPRSQASEVRSCWHLVAGFWRRCLRHSMLDVGCSMFDVQPAAGAPPLHLRFDDEDEDDEEDAESGRLPAAPAPSVPRNRQRDSLQRLTFNAAINPPTERRRYIALLSTLNTQRSTCFPLPPRPSGDGPLRPSGSDPSAIICLYLRLPSSPSVMPTTIDSGSERIGRPVRETHIVKARFAIMSLGSNSTFHPITPGICLSNVRCIETLATAPPDACIAACAAPDASLRLIKSKLKMSAVANQNARNNLVRFNSLGMTGSHRSSIGCGMQHSPLPRNGICLSQTG
jgi:hypothetical protein